MPRARAVEPPVIKDLSLDTSFVKIGTDMYTLRKVRGKFDIAKEVKDWYEARYQNAIIENNAIVASGFQEEWTKQIDRLSDARKTQKVIVPSQMYDKPMLYRNRWKAFLEIREAMWHPVTIVCNRINMRAYDYDYDDDPEDNLWKNTLRAFFHTTIPDNEQVELVLKNDIYEPILVGFDTRGKTVYTPNHNLSHSFSDGRFCIGQDRNFNPFYAMDTKELGIQISRINMFSLANNHIRVNKWEGEIYDIIKASKIVRVDRRSEWSTR